MVLFTTAPKDHLESFAHDVTAVRAVGASWGIPSQSFTCPFLSGRGDPPADRAERHARDVVGMAPQRDQRLVHARYPEFDDLSRARRGDAQSRRGGTPRRSIRLCPQRALRRGFPVAASQKAGRSRPRPTRPTAGRRGYTPGPRRYYCDPPWSPDRLPSRRRRSGSGRSTRRQPPGVRAERKRANPPLGTGIERAASSRWPRPR